MLKNYCRNADIKTAITVGIVGLPNVGKSSLINSLKRSRAAQVGCRVRVRVGVGVGVGDGGGVRVWVSSPSRSSARARRR